VSEDSGEFKNMSIQDLSSRVGHCTEHTSIGSRDMADHGSKCEEIGGDTSQMAEEDIACLMRG